LLEEAVSRRKGEHGLPFVLINGASSGFFSSTQGLRQGDLLSPLLFVVVIEALSKMMSATMDRGLLAGFTVGLRCCRNGCVAFVICR